ncbi:uncharacterized protein LOC129568935 [Sitodiplosis mosellana]|uniref:uncharacterized protein LOC129568935 n=1 Tax=Sitodiplosis mosellana TaxID=263140 RepID=UPI0024443C95|nr:uncharacterized protein LOC129568935 [Sitodiplosis mosellana]
MSVGSASADVIRNNQSQAEIFKLKIDHFEELFDWLSLNNLVALSKTCKRMQRIAGYYIKTTYAAVKFNCFFTSIYVRDLKMDELSSYMKKLAYDQCLIEHVRHMRADQFKSVTEIRLRNVTFSDVGISRIKEILGQLETVKLINPRFTSPNQEFYVSFLQYCTNVKKLCIQSMKIPIVGRDNGWLLRQYPTLEHFELTYYEYGNRTVDELAEFFEQNTNIKTFATNTDIILKHKNIFKNTKAKWDVLSVQWNSIFKFDWSLDILNELHERGLFRQLHVYFDESYLDQGTVNGLTSFNGLTKLFIGPMKNGIDLSPLIGLKQLHILMTDNITNKSILAETLVNLEFIQFVDARVDDIHPFIRFSPNLTKISVCHLKEKDGHTLNIEQLNKERSKLSNARKVTIYVEEHVYLAVKWAKNQTNRGFIEIKRSASCDTLNHMQGTNFLL